MADYRQIHTCIWKDSWFIELKQSYKLLFIYLFSNERACLTGLYDLSLRVVAFETDLPMDVILAGLAEFERAGKVFYEDGMVWVPTLLRHNARNITSPKIQAHIRTLLSSTRDCPLKSRWIEYYNTMVGERYRIDTLSIPNLESDREHDQEQEQEQEQEQDTEDGADAPPADAGPTVDSAKFKTFDQWRIYIQQATPKKRQVCLREMYIVLYPGTDPPGYGYIGKTARQVGGAGRLAELLWQHSTRPPTGDVLAYLLRVHQGGNGNAGRQSASRGPGEKDAGKELADQVARAFASGPPDSG